MKGFRRMTSNDRLSDEHVELLQQQTTITSYTMQSQHFTLHYRVCQTHLLDRTTDREMHIT